DGSERRQLLDRKLDQVYRGLPYRAAQHLYRQSEGRRDDVFLFCAFNNPAFLQPWLQRIQAQQSLLAGIYALPMLSRSLLPTHGLHCPHLLFGESLSSGFRQTYFDHGHMRFSRLVPARHARQSMTETDDAAEMEKTAAYLSNQRYLDSAAELQHVVVRRQHVPDSSAADDHARLAKRYKLDQQALQHYPELMHMHLLASGPRPVNLAPATATANYRCRRRIWMIHSATLLIMLAGIFLSRLLFDGAAAHEAKTRQIAAAAARQEALLRQTTGNLPLILDAQALQQLTLLQSALKLTAELPEVAIGTMAEALAGCSGIRLLHLGWHWPPDGRADNALTPSPELSASMLEVSAEAGLSSGDAQMAEAGIRCFAAKLEADRRVEQVVFLQKPASADAQSQSQALDENHRPASFLPFKLGIRLRMADA
ncbi:MAG: hypothetical protein RL194_1505, partial [Pseudomonadota bacterium]